MMLDSIRSMLFVSGEKPERFGKALASGADLVCIDLEDAVLPEHKPTARQAAIAFAAHHVRDTGGAGLAVRLNAVRTHEGLADIAALVDANVRFDAILLPKVEHPEELALFSAWLPDAADTLVALIETPLGVENAAAIGAAARRDAPRLGALMLGGADLAAELGAEFGWDGLLAARGRIVNAARASGLQAWDVPFLDLEDEAALTAETLSVARMGFGCKTAIHPRQIAGIHAAFAPSATDRRWAEALIEADAARAGNGRAAGAFLFEGRMVDAPVLRKARRIAQLADRLSSRGATAS